MISSMWLDDSKRPLPDKVRDAVKFFEEKYKLPVKVIRVHPATPGIEVPINGIDIQTTRSVRPNYFWLADEEEAYTTKTI